MLKSEPNKTITFRGHAYIVIGGDAYTPPRGWKVKLLTTEEYNQLPSHAKPVYRTIKQTDLYLLEMHFGKE